MSRLETTTAYEGTSATILAVRELSKEPLVEVICTRLSARGVKVTIRSVPAIASLLPGEAWGTDDHLDVAVAFRGAQRTYDTNAAIAGALPAFHFPRVNPGEWDQIERELVKLKL